MTKATNGNIPQLTSLRFFAAFAILIEHYRDFFGHLDTAVFDLIVGGRVGVEFFYVLSGFILTYNYEQTFSAGVKPRDFFRFQKFRFARVYPTYLVALILDIPVETVCRKFSEGDYWFAWITNAFAVQAWVPLYPYVLFWNMPGWSISCEFFFYFCFPFICAFFVQHLKSVRHAIALSLFIVLITLAINVVIINSFRAYPECPWQTKAALQSYLPPVRIAEFVIGCIAGRMFLERRSERIKSWFFDKESNRNLILIVASIISIYLAGKHWYDGPDLNLFLLDQASTHVPYSIPFALIVLSIASGNTFLSKPLAHPVLVLLGEASYALYITQYLGFTIRAFMFAGDNRTIISVFFMAYEIVFSVIVYKFFEVPFRKRLRRLKFFGS